MAGQIFHSLGQLSNELAPVIADPVATGRDVPVYNPDPPIPLAAFTDTSGVGMRGVWRKQPSLRKVVGFIARHLASTPLHVYRRVSDTDRQRVTDGPLYDLLSNPSGDPVLSAYRFWEFVLIDGLLYDRWCVYPMRRQDGAGWELQRLPANVWRLESDRFGRVTAMKIVKDGREQVFDHTSCLVDYGYSGSAAGGVPALSVLAADLEEQSYATQFRRDVYTRGARVSQVVNRDRAWPSAEIRNRFLEQLREFQYGNGRAGGTLLLEDGMSMGSIDMLTPQQLQTLEQRTASEVQVCSVYYVPPELLGVREGNFASIDAFKNMLFGPVLEPYYTAWSEALKKLVDLVQPGEDLYIEPHIEAKLRGSFIEQAKVGQAMVGAPSMSRNEFRARLNLPAVEGGDELVTPLNVTEGGQASPQDATPDYIDNPGSDPGNTGMASRGRLGVKKGPTTSPGKAAARARSGMYQTAMAAYLDKQCRSVVAALDTKSGAAWWDQVRYDAELAAMVYELDTKTVDQVGSAVNPDFNSQQTRNYLALKAQEVAKAFNLQTLADLKAALASMEPDRSRAEIAEETYTNKGPARAARFGVVEVTDVAGFATMEAGKQGGAVSKTWITGANARPEHRAMGGETVALDEDFSNGTPWPGGPGADEEDYGCNCDMRINYGSGA